MDEVVSWLHYPLCPNKKVVNKSIDEIIDIFWKEFKHFTYRTRSFSYHSSCFKNDNAFSGQCYLWHEEHSLPFTEVLGFVACQNMSKHIVIGYVERPQSDVKTIRNGKHENYQQWGADIFGGESLERRAILYITTTTKGWYTILIFCSYTACIPDFLIYRFVYQNFQFESLS